MVSAVKCDENNMLIQLKNTVKYLEIVGAMLSHLSD